MGAMVEKIVHATVVRTGRSAAAFLRLLARWERSGADGAADAAYVRQARQMARRLDTCAEQIEAELPAREGATSAEPEAWRPTGEVR